MPVVTLSASYTNSNNNYYDDQGLSIHGLTLTSNDVYTIELDLTWNIFKGMSDFETVKQNAYTYGAQQATTAYQLRDVVVDVNNDYRTVKSNASVVKANLQAVLAGEEALKQALAQYKVGVDVCNPSSSSSSSSSSSCSSGAGATSPLVNVLEKIKLLTQSQQSYVQSKYDYISSKISLALDAGTLSKKDIIALNYWLTDKKSTSNLYDFEKSKEI